MDEENYIDNTENSKKLDAKTLQTENTLSPENYEQKPSAIYKKMLIKEKYLKNKRRFN